MANEGLEFSHNDVELNEEMAEMLFPRRRFCFCIPCFGGSNRSAAVGVHWWWDRGINALKKLREWSEIAAGPRWKTFIRRFNRSKSGGGGARQGKFQYDPLSYALNFDDGQVQNGDSDETFRSFSSRYASIPISVKSSMDRDASSFA
ncbi:hypothetical protein CsSME_00053322 [Camellia sinensis var. sinensis]